MTRFGASSSSNNLGHLTEAASSSQDHTIVRITWSDEEDLEDGSNWKNI